MDRNVVIATVLIAIIMLVWLTWLAPPPPAPPAGTDSVAVEVPQPDLLEDDQPIADEQTAVDSALAGAQEGEERFITVETDLYQARFSSKGGTPISFTLKEYKKFDQETPVELISREDQGALGLVFTTPSNHLVDTRDLFFDYTLERDTLVVSNAPTELAFEARVGQGMIRQTYTFLPEEYEVRLRVEQVGAESFATREGYELAWYGGLPFTEDNLQDEARHVGAYAMSGGEVEYIDLNDGEADTQRLSGDVSWVAVKNKYFAGVIMPQGETRGAELEGEQIGNLDAGTLWKDLSARVLMPSATAQADSFTLYIGPLEYFRITDYGVGLYDMVDYGYDFFEWMTRPLAKFIFIPVFTFLGRWLPNYGIVIIVFSILMKIALYPLTQSSFKNMARMRELQPKMEAIKAKYPDDPQKQQQAMMAMYKETGINPLGGCLPMLLQWPVLIALYQFIPQSLELRQAGFLWANDLSAPDVILRLPFSIPFYGDFVAGFTLLMGLSMVVQMQLQSQPTANAQTKILTYTMPIMLFMIFNRFASGLSLYYLIYNIVTAIQQLLINKTTHKESAGPEVGGAQEAGKARKPSSFTDGKQKKGGRPSKKQRL